MSKRPVRSSKRSGDESSNLRQIGIVAAIVIALGAVAYLLYLNLRSPGEIEGVVRVSGLTRAHDNEVEYTQSSKPPAGGVHFDRWQNCGVYTEPIETGHAIHSLEHGAVWITYRPDLPQAEVGRLQGRVNQQTYLLLSPYPGQESPIVLTAWGVQLEVDSASDGRMDQFITRYRLGPTTPEPGASCQDGVGDPA